MTVANVLLRGAKQELTHVIDFATTPVGPFSIVDQMISTARHTVRNVGSEVGVTVPGRLRGSRLRGQLGGRLGTLRGRLPKLLRRY